MHPIIAQQIPRDQGEEARMIEQEELGALLEILAGFEADEPLGQQLDLRRRKPSLAPRGHEGHEKRDDAQKRHQQERLDKPQDSGDDEFPAGAQKLSCVKIRIGLHT